MIELTLEAMSTTIRRGDAFGLTLTVKNSANSTITVARWDVIGPPGFKMITPYSSSQSASQPDSKKGLGMITSHFQHSDAPLFAYYYNDDGTPLAVLGPSESYTFTVQLRAGYRFGVAPRPDTYKVSVNVGYADGQVGSFSKPPLPPHSLTGEASINVYPTLAGMISGTILGAALGTLLSSSSSVSSLSVAAVLAFFPKLLTSVILGMIAGIVFMRKKDVQPFITIEDFWGGILVGFVVGFYGQSYFEKITGLA